jgi:SAM-dependent methyltransferase
MGYPGPPDPAASFRDPAGRLLCVQGRIIRVVNSSGAKDATDFLSSSAARKLLDSGQLVGSKLVDLQEPGLADSEIATLVNPQDGDLLIEHERVPFPSFPYEWPPEMLYAAALLTLDLAEGLLEDGLGLKDATPYNVLFPGPKPIFVDILSIERRDPGDATWLPYGQFIRTFLLPLLCSKFFSLRPHQTLLTSRDGLEPEDVYRWLKPAQKIRPPFLSLVSIPTWLAAGHDKDDAGIYRRKSLSDTEKAQFILSALFRRLRNSLQRLNPEEGMTSAWSDYMQASNYSNEQFVAKEAFIKEALAKQAPRRVLDAGCNTGHFSVMAAKSGASVVAIDKDPVVTGALWRRACSEKLNILPLVEDLTRPTPAVGWRNQECLSFLDRARGHFDALFMLALIHHMLVTERVPLPDIVDLAAELTTDQLIIEFIDPRDSMFQRITRGREALHKDLTPAVFENACRRHFEVVRSLQLPGSHRWIYWLRKTK